MGGANHGSASLSSHICISRAKPSWFHAERLKGTGEGGGRGGGRDGWEGGCIARYKRAESSTLHLQIKDFYGETATEELYVRRM